MRARRLDFARRPFRDERPVFVVGANYRSAPLELLERLAAPVSRR